MTDIRYPNGMVDAVQLFVLQGGQPVAWDGKSNAGITPWTATSAPAVNTQASVTKAAAGSGIKNVCKGFTVTLAAGATAPAAIQLVVNLIDGASGATSYLWRSVIALPASAGAMAAIVRSNIWIEGTPNTPMTLEFSVAGGANTFESVSIDGTTS